MNYRDISVKLCACKNLDISNIQPNFKKTANKILYSNDKTEKEIQYIRNNILKKTKQFPDPYWNLQGYVFPHSHTHFSLQKYKNVYFDKKNKVNKDVVIRENIDAYRKLTVYTRFFFDILCKYKLFNNRKLCKIAIFTKNVYLTGLEDILTYRLVNSSKSKNDKIHIYDYKTDLYPNNRQSNQHIYKQLHRYNNFDIINIRESFCNNNFQIVKESKQKYDFMEFSVFHYLREKREMNELSNTQNLLSSIIIIGKHLEKGGNVFINMYSCKYGITSQLLQLLCYHFTEVHLVKSKYRNPIRPYFSVIAKGFKCMKKNVLDLLLDISQKYYKLNSDCGITDNIYLHQILKKKCYEIDTFIKQFLLETNDLRMFAVNSIVLLYNQLKNTNINKCNKILQNVIERNNIILNNYLLKSGLISKSIVKSNAIYTLNNLQQNMNKNRFEPIHIVFDKKNIVKNNDNLDKLDIDLAFINLDGRLKQVKNLIDNTNDTKWSNISYKMKLFRELKKVITKQYLNGVTISQAFLKMTEILNFINVIDKKQINKNGVFKTFSICEAPGQFILAINNFIQTNITANYRLEWLANSLNPLSSEVKNKYGNVFGDDYKLMQNHMDNWLFGKNQTGDITNIDNIKDFKKYVPNDINLMTSDCGLQMRDEKLMAEQETYMTLSNLAQICCALFCMPVKCNFIFKTFLPAVKNINVSLIYLLYKCFNKIIFYKPLVNPGSSEFYIVCLDYKGDNEVKKLDGFKKMFSLLKATKLDVNDCVINNWQKDTDFVGFYINSIKMLIDKTCESIYRTLAVYNGNITGYNYNALRNKAVKSWIKFFKIKKNVNILKL